MYIFKRKIQSTSTIYVIEILLEKFSLLPTATNAKISPFIMVSFIRTSKTESKEKSETTVFVKHSHEN
jgi:hypothetical protein